MSAHSSVQFASRRKAWSGTRFLTGSVSAALVFAAIIVGIDVSVAIARSGAVSSGISAGQIVNRVSKGNRQQIAPAGQHGAAKQHGEIEASRPPVVDSKLAIGCESLISPLAHPLLARVARRCLA
jgi:hypothetical protein